MHLPDNILTGKIIMHDTYSALSCSHQFRSRLGVTTRYALYSSSTRVVARNFQDSFPGHLLRALFCIGHGKAPLYFRKETLCHVWFVSFHVVLHWVRCRALVSRQFVFHIKHRNQSEDVRYSLSYSKKCLHQSHEIQECKLQSVC